jgi:hypothetical protein
MAGKFSEVNWSPDTRERKKFALTLMAGFPFMGLMFSVIGRLASGQWHFVVPGWVAGVGFSLACILWLLPAIALPFYRVWFFLICVIDTILTYVLLTLLFYVVITPAGLLYRLLARKTFQTRPDPAKATYWSDVPPVTDVSRYYRQF